MQEKKTKTETYYLKSENKGQIKNQYFQKLLKSTGFNCDPDKIRTCNLLIRSQMRYPIAPQGL